MRGGGAGEAGGAEVGRWRETSKAPVNKPSGGKREERLETSLFFLLFVAIY